MNRTPLWKHLLRAPCTGGAVLIKALLMTLLMLYRYGLSPLISLFYSPPCRFHPSCSAYAVICLKKDPLPRALRKIISRLLRCHPFSPGGVDLP